MDAVRGLLIFLLLGLATPAHGVLREFHFVNLLKNWTEAQRYCREKLFDLVTMESADDWARVREIVGNSAHTEAWIGLYDDVSNWRWSLGNTSISKGELGTWFDFTPDNAGGNDNCGSIGGGILFDRPCNHIPYAVCYDEPSNSYILFLLNRNWQTAQSYCRQTYTDLASIRNQQEFDAISSVTDPTLSYWIGLSKQWNPEGWKWSDQSGSTLRVWGPSEPSPKAPTCGAAAVDGWKAVQCFLERPFICSAPEAKVLKLTLKTDGSVNLNKPLGKKAVVKQMEKDVREQGVHQEFNLRWRKRQHGDVFNKTEL